MDSLRTELMVYGYIRKYFESRWPQLAPDDIMRLFILWSSMEQFDTLHCHPDIEIDSHLHTQFRRVSTESHDKWASITGSDRIQQGHKWRWKLAFAGFGAIIGIIEEDKLKSYETISDFTDSKNGGYGLSTISWNYMHADDEYVDGDIETYAEQFKMYKNLVITMELDMIGNNGTLRYFIHNQKENGIEKIRTDNEYTNVTYDDIDINKTYRMIIAIDNKSSTCNKWVELLY